jgi:16S rRNA G1207 methylase RsmC
MTDAAQAFANIVAKIPKAKREELRPLIEQVQQALGSKDDLFVDGRKKMWAIGGSARLKVETRPEPKTHRASWRNGGTIECTTAEAVKLSRRKSAGALAVTISTHGGKFHFMDGDDIVTITRI